MINLLVAVSPYDWDTHSVIIEEKQVPAYKKDRWSVYRFTIDPDNTQETIYTLYTFFELLSDTNFQGDFAEIATILGR